MSAEVIPLRPACTCGPYKPSPDGTHLIAQIDPACPTHGKKAA